MVEEPTCHFSGHVGLLNYIASHVETAGYLPIPLFGMIPQILAAPACLTRESLIIPEATFTVLLFSAFLCTVFLFLL